MAQGLGSVKGSILALADLDQGLQQRWYTNSSNHRCKTLPLDRRSSDQPAGGIQPIQDK
jgi:hypothetical protein